MSENIKKYMSVLDKKLSSDMQDEISDEIKKGSKRCDIDKIIELTDEIYGINHGENNDISAKTADSKKELIDKLVNSEKPNHLKLYKRIASLAACIIVVIGLNTASLKVFGQNMFSAVYQLSKGTIIIDMKNEETIELPTTPDDPYGIKTKCAEYGFVPEVPTYIPEGFKLTMINEESTSQTKDIIFYYQKGEVKLDFSYCYYKNSEILPIGIPTDTYNIEENYVNGNLIYIMNEDNQFKACYMKENIQYSIYTEYMEYDESYKILESMS